MIDIEKWLICRGCQLESVLLKLNIFICGYLALLIPVSFCYVLLNIHCGQIGKSAGTGSLVDEGKRGDGA